MIRVFAHLADRPGRLLAVCLALNAIFLPYTGIDNDAILYAFQVVNAGSGRFDGDLFFRYGNQGAYTLVPALLAGPAEQFGSGLHQSAFRGDGERQRVHASTAFSRSV